MHAAPNTQRIGDSMHAQGQEQALHHADSNIKQQRTIKAVVRTAMRMRTCTAQPAALLAASLVFELQ